ncbi:Phosphomannomutase [Bienertia sinuspersici]
MTSIASCNVGGKSLWKKRKEIPFIAQMAAKRSTLALFDVDGTLTAPRKGVTPEMLEFMKELRKSSAVTSKGANTPLPGAGALHWSRRSNVVPVGVVGGSDLIKISEQLGKTVPISNECMMLQSLKKLLGEEKLKEFINFTLKYIADLDIPIKRGTFIEFRNGMINVSPIGRNCSQEERDEFEKFDKVHKIRETMVSVLREKFGHFNLTFSIGGQISFDVFPHGWDKTYSLRYLEHFNEIHFFGDKTFEGGNDYEIFVSDRTIGHTVTSPEDTRKQCTEIFLSKRD